MTLVADPVIGLFMEDIAHEKFITSLVERIASESGTKVEFDVRNATRGIPQMRGELRRFLRDHTQIGNSIFDILIIVQDADHNSEAETKNEIQRHIERIGYPGETIVAVPDPHIEAWYLADPISIQAIGGSQNLIQTPQGDSEKDRYKRELSRAFPYAPLGGIEYADEIVMNMDLYCAGRNVSSLRHFIDDLRSTLTHLASSN